MPADDSLSEQARDHRKLFGSKHNWRARLFSRDESARAGGDPDDSVASFLQNTGSTPSAKDPGKQSGVHEDSVLQFLHEGRESAVAKPRIDTSRASRWPAAADLSKDAIPRKPVSRPGSSRNDEAARSRSRPGRDKKSLVVRFAETDPEVMGEGGDESEIPTREMRTAQQETFGVQYEWHPSGRHFARPPSPAKPMDEPARITLQRVPTGLDSRARTPTADGSMLSPPIQDEHRSIRDSTDTVDDILSRFSAHSSLDSSPTYHMRKRHDAPVLPQGEFPLAQPFGSAPSHTSARESTSTTASVYTTASMPSSASRLSQGPQTPPAESLPNSFESFQMTQPRNDFPSSLISGMTPMSMTGSFEVSPRRVDESFKNQSHSKKHSTISSIVQDDGEDDQFYNRVLHLRTALELSATSRKSLMEVVIVDWLRAGIWWFLKGRAGVETRARARSSSRSSSEDRDGHDVTIALKQAWIDLSKCWWIVRDVLQKQTEIQGSSAFDRKSSLESKRTYEALLGGMKMLVASMVKNRLLPPKGLLLQGADLAVWIEYPGLTPRISDVLSRGTQSIRSDTAYTSREVLWEIPIGDTSQHYSFGRMFVEVVTAPDFDTSDYVTFACVLSILRDRSDTRVEITIVSQDGQVNLHVQSDPTRGLTWGSVKWIIKSHGMRIRLQENFYITIQMSDHDFKILWGIHNYTKEVQNEWQPQENEELVFEETLDLFQQTTKSNDPMAFSDPTEGCTVRLFEMAFTVSNNTGRSREHNGHRLIIMTPPSIKTLTRTNITIGHKIPIFFSYLRGGQDSPALLLSVIDEGQRSSLIMTFDDTSTRAELHSLMNGLFISDDETLLGKMPFKELTITRHSADPRLAPQALWLASDVEWQNLKVIRKTTVSVDHKLTGGSSDHIRICMENNYGTVTDRISLVPGEIQMSLDPIIHSCIRLLRPPQRAITVSFANNLLPDDDKARLPQVVETVAESTTIRTFMFPSMLDLHKFQALSTGFSVIYDGSATSFAISRRRTVMSTHKRQETNNVRLQVLRMEKVHQLLAFFVDDFGLGTCMSLPLRATDVYETSGKSGKFYVRFADAKYALPKSQHDETRHFVCLDLPEYASEHEDIMIGFNRETGK
ncbi:hypothetical protein MMC09_002565 [Bachmanniomyces sp. S44760]|nr:hypothetical protein [Bachmanniomyces sp. S44760]